MISVCYKKKQQQQQRKNKVEKITVLANVASIVLACKQIVMGEKISCRILSYAVHLETALQHPNRIAGKKSCKQ